MPRRRVLHALVLAPAALAGCAAARGEGPAGTPAPAGEGGDAPPPRAAASGAIDAVRAFRLPPDAEPAAIFRAAAARPGDAR